MSIFVSAAKGQALASTIETITGARAEIVVKDGETYVYWNKEEARKIDSWLFAKREPNKIGDTSSKLNSNLLAVVTTSLLKRGVPILIVSVLAIYFLGVIDGKKRKRKS